MGEYADMMLEGSACAGCGEYLFNDDPLGIPTYCSNDCAPNGYTIAKDGSLREISKPKRAPARLRRANGNMDSIAGNISALNKVANVDATAIDLARMQKIYRRIESLKNRVEKAHNRSVKS